MIRNLSSPASSYQRAPRPGRPITTGYATQGKSKGEALKRLGLSILVMLQIWGTVNPGYAEEVAGNPSGGAGISQATPDKAKEDDRVPIHKQDHWQFFLSPYLWIPGINFTTSTLRSTQGINVPWWNVASTLFSNTFGMMGRAEAWKGRWGFFLDGFYTYVGVSGSDVGASRDKTFGPVDFTTDKQAQLGGATITLAIPGSVAGNVTLTPSGSAKSISRLGNLDLGGRFLVGTWPLDTEKPLPALSMELLGGPRFNSINQYTRINLSDIKIGDTHIDISKFSLTGRHVSLHNGSLVFDYNNQYFEPFLGMRFGLWLTQHWLINLKGDVGGFGLVADDHVDCNLEALVGYRFNKNIYAWAGYKAHGTWYDLGKDLVQINFSGWFHGPVLGMTYAF